MIEDVGAALSLAVDAKEAASGALGIFDEIFNRIDSVRKRKLSAANYLRAYYFEVINNLEMLDVVNASRFRAEKVNSPLMKALLARLDTKVGASILFAEGLEQGSELCAFLKAQGRIRNPKGVITKLAKGREEPARGATFYENVLQAISFTVVKTEILRRLSAFADEELDMLNGVMLERRIANIRERYVMIKDKMDELKGIRELSR